MNVRQTLREKPMAAGAVAAGLLLTAVICIGLQSRGPDGPAAGERAFFSIDDGKTWFADDAKKRPPFTKDGKEAVRAYVYRSSDGKTFVNHLERFTPEAKQALDEADKADPKGKGAADLSSVQSAYTSGRELKRPGEAKWTSSGNAREVGKVLAIKSPSGSGDATPVTP